MVGCAEVPSAGSGWFRTDDGRTRLRSEPWNEEEPACRVGAVCWSRSVDATRFSGLRYYNDCLRGSKNGLPAS